jgi:lipopolysaccharide transport system permease protein
MTTTSQLEAPDKKNTCNLPITTYSAASPLSDPRALVSELFSDLWKSKELTWTLFLRDTRADYRQSILGFLWMFIPILATTFVWTFLFNYRIIKVDDPPVPYAIHVMVGTLIWYMFTSAINQPLASFNAGQGIFMKLKVPPEAFIISGMFKIFTDVLIRLLVLIPVFFYFQITPPLTILLFPFALLGTAIVGMAIGVLMIPLGSLYGDIPRIFGTAVALGFYITPIIFPIPKTGFAATVVTLNPATALIQVPRDLLTYGIGDFISPFLVLVLFFSILLILSFLLLRAVLPILVERMGM